MGLLSTARLSECGAWMIHHFSAHPTADVSPGATIGARTRIWHHCQVREGAIVGADCILGKDVYVDAGVRIGDNVKIENGVSVYHGVTLEDGVFCGPHCVFTNDRRPRAVNADGSLRAPGDWCVSTTLVRMGASIGAHATVVCGVTIGRWAMVGAGAVVTRDVPDYGLAYGNPARLQGFVCPCGERLEPLEPQLREPSGPVAMVCPACRAEILIPQADWMRLASPERRR